MSAAGSAAGFALQLKLKLIGAGLVTVFLLLVLAALVILGGPASAGEGEAPSGALSCGASPQGRLEIPKKWIPMYESAAAARDKPAQQPLGDRGVWVLAAIHKTESGFRDGREDPVFGPPTRYGRAVGPMQFLLSTWKGYAIDGDGDGRKDPQNPADAIPAAAKLLRANGAPRNWYRAVFAYNHADSYTQGVLGLADTYQGTCTFVGGEGSPDGVEKVSASDPWLVPVPGTPRRCDRRILEDVVYLLQRFKLMAGDCYAPTGHSSGGEHPLGLAIDVVPADGNWDHTMAAARFLGWDESCGANGCPNQLARWIGYNGVADHGDPQHCSGSCPPHLHISWNHSPAAYNTQADWVMVWRLPTEAAQ